MVTDAASFVVALIAAAVARAAAVAARVLRLRARRGSRRVRQCAGDAGADRLDRDRGGAAAARADARRRPDGDGGRRRGPGRQPGRRVDAVARRGRHQRARRAAARDRRPAGLGRGARGRRGHLPDGLDADRPDPVARRGAPDPALDARCSCGSRPAC